MSTLVGPDDCAFCGAPDVDTAVPTPLARARRAHARGSAVSWCDGRYGHVSFIVDPAPVRLRVLEVVPPWPPKLVDQLRRVLDVAEDLPPVELVPSWWTSATLARDPAAPNLPAPVPRRRRRRSAGASTSYLDEDPAARAVDAGRVRPVAQIHEWFYGERGAAGRHVPAPGRRTVAGAAADQVLPARGPGRRDDDTVVVPWGATLAQISEALAAVSPGRGSRWDPV